MDNHLEAEYHELNDHIRECWKYISDLLRNFLFLQIILISLVFLGGNVIRIESVSVGLSAVSSAQSTEANPAARAENPNNSRFRKLAILPLMFIGLVGSFGAIVQNYRLFNNATNYIHRAAFLESRGGFLKDGRTSHSDKTLPPNTYMSENLYPGKKINLRHWLTATYLSFAVLWVYTLFLFIHSLSF